MELKQGCLQTRSKFNQESFRDYVARTHTTDIQSIRGKKGGLLGGGVAKKGGRPNIQGNPWIKLGIRRASWYRKFCRKE